MLPINIHINDIIEYYITFFDSEDYSNLPSEDWFDFSSHSASCAEYTRDKSYLDNNDFICFDSKQNTCF